MRRKVWMILPLLVALVVGASFAGCVGSSGSSHSTPTPTATATATPTATPTPGPPATSPTPTPHPSKALVGFVIGFKVINASYSTDGGKTWINFNQGGGFWPILLLVQPYLIFPNGTKEALLTPQHHWVSDFFYVIGFNRTQGWHGANYDSYMLPFWGNTTFYFSTVWNNKTFYEKILPLLEKGAKIELRMGLTISVANLGNFTEAVRSLTRTNPIPVIYLNWTPGQNVTKVFVYAWTVNEKGVSNYGYKYKIYAEIWIRPVYMPWGQYPSWKLYPSKIPGNNYPL